MSFRTRISLATLFDLLGDAQALLALEIELLDETLRNVHVPDLREAIEGVQRELHFEQKRLKYSIRRMGGDPALVTPLAQVERPVVESIAHTLPRHSWDFGLRAVLYACSLEKVLWGFLGTVAAFIPYSRISGVLEEEARRAQPAVQDRTEWLETTLMRLLLQRAMRDSRWDEAA